MQEVLIFSGTSEGRKLAERLAESQMYVTVCVATEYGQEVMEQESPYIRVQAGRLSEIQIEELIQKKPWKAVVDATHPFAVEVTENIAKACKNQNCQVLRLLREESSGYAEGVEGMQKEEAEEAGKVTYVNSVQGAVSYLNQTRGNIFLTTGSKELLAYLEGIADVSRVYVRILPNGAEVENCRRLGLKGKQIICMQGPFSTELNIAMLREIQASVLVTKETSQAGGFPQKLQAAFQTGTEVVVIRRQREQGYSMEEVLRCLGIEPDFPENEKTAGSITLAGMGMGNPSNMTREVYEACQDSDLIIGADRMLKGVEHLKKPMERLYRSEEITDYIRNHPQYRKIVILLSGDVGFYSGARKLREALGKLWGEEEGNYEICQLCGVPSVVYFASRLGMAWEDLALMSLHGRQQNLIGILETYGKLFALTEGAPGIRSLSQELLDYGLTEVEMYVGYQLSYPQEEIFKGKPRDFLTYDREGASVVILQKESQENVVTHGIPDETFLRGKVPMTKAEVRSISLSKLALTREAVVYDIGAGTGSVAVECARQAVSGKVYAIEKNQKALELIRKNKYKHRVWNLEIAAGEAPEALKDLPMPTHAFIGGSSGKLRGITELLWEKNPRVRIVLNAISLETLREVMELSENMVFSEKEIVQVSVAKAKELGQHQLMMGQNPVYVITLQK